MGMAHWQNRKMNNKYRRIFLISNRVMIYFVYSGEEIWKLCLYTEYKGDNLKKEGKQKWALSQSMTNAWIKIFQD